MGCVYILENPSMPDLIKIGFTTKTAEERAKKLYDGSLGVPKPFVVVHTNDCEDPKKLEAIVHKQLAKHRINKDREFFKYAADDAYQLVKDLHKESQQGRKPLFSKKLFSRKNIKTFIIGNFLILLGYLINVLKFVGDFISNLFRGPH